MQEIVEFDPVVGDTGGVPDSFLNSGSSLLNELSMKGVSSVNL